jgi:hypothetical protein
MRTLIIIIGTVFLTLSAADFFKPNSSKDGEVSFFADYPRTTNVEGLSSFSCKSLMHADIIGDNSGALKEKKGIHGSVSSGTDTIAMKIKDKETLVFITGTAVEVGTAEGDEFYIVQNDKASLVAALNKDGAMSTISIHKESGLGVWLKGRPDFFGYGPYGAVMYLSCN